MKPEIVVTFVHGTFAKGAAWTKNDSPFVEELRAAFGERIAIEEALPWSGGNSIFDRQSAAHELKRRVRNTKIRYPESRHFVIAHSHGGNVALYATQLLDDTDSIAGIACLSTPFLHANLRDWRPLTSKLIQSSFFTVLMALTVFICTDLGVGWRWYLAGGVIDLLIVATAAGVGSALIEPFHETATTFTRHVTARLPPNFNLCIIRIVGDEASLALGVGQALAWATRTAFAQLTMTVGSGAWKLPVRHQPLTRPLFVGRWILGAWLLTHLLSAQLPWLPNPRDFGGIAVAMLMFAVLDESTLLDYAFLPIVVILLAAATALTTQWLGTIPSDSVTEELSESRRPLRWLLRMYVGLGTALMFDVQTESAPPGSWMVTHYPPDPPVIRDQFDLQHSSYNDSRVRSHVLAWLTSSVNGREPLLNY